MHILFFDGDCALCNKTVQEIVRRDPQRAFGFSPLASAFAHQALAKHRVDASRLDSVVILADAGTPQERLLVKSDAAMFAGKAMGGVYRLSTMLAFLPKAMRDRGYDFIAKRRYAWFGKADTCAIPTAEFQQRIVTEAPRDA